MIRIEDGGPAFPVEVSAGADGYLVGRQTGSQSGYATGISIRDYFAAKAMQGLIEGYDFEIRELSHGKNRTGFDDFPEMDAPTFAQSLATESYLIADAMLKARLS